MSDVLSGVTPKYASEMALCASRLEFRKHELGEKSVRKWLSCNRRWCPICAWRKSKVRYGAALKNLPMILSANPGMRFAMWTFTVRNCPVDELATTVAFMGAAFRRLTLRKSLPISGYVRSLEITFPREGEAHPHFHVIVARDKRARFPNHADLVKAWRECLRVDYDPSVEAHMIRASADDQLLIKALGQVLKYSIKPMNELPFVAWAIPAIAQLKGVRFVSTGGIFDKLFEEGERPDLSPVVHSDFYAHLFAGEQSGVSQTGYHEELRHGPAC